MECSGFRLPWLVVGVAMIWCACAPRAVACTGIRVETKDGAVIYARTLEFGYPLQSQIVVLPRGLEYAGTTSDNRPGIRWKSRWGVVGANAQGLPHIVDGVNEQGLAGGLFYHPGYAAYPATDGANVDKALAPWEFMTWVLTTFASVSEARAGLDKVVVCAAVQSEMGLVPPVHAILHDAAGNCLVIEFVGGKVQTYANPLGVITNAPTFDWHVTNLRNYVNLTATNVPPVKLDGLEIRQFGEGTGLLGLPGDYTPPSRFVRAVAFSNAAEKVETAEEGVLLAQHILNSFDIFVGLVRGHGDARKYPELTQWTTFADLKNRAYYFRTYDDPRMRKVDLSRVRLDGGKVTSISMQAAQPLFDDVSGQAK